MPRRRRGRPLHGWVIIDKPKGLSSARVVGRVRAMTGAAKAGHAGTLDPLATGVLPIALGEATKTVAWVMNGSKAYRFGVRWGEARTTDDAEGDITETCQVRPSASDLHAVLAEFVGQIEQVPPAYSAIKVGGERSYALARANTHVQLSPRTVSIESLSLQSQPDPDHAVFDVRCGKGMYVRSLARDIALRIGTVGHVSEIRRVATGPFDESDAISLDNLDALLHSAPPQSYLLAVETALDGIPALSLNETQAEYLQHGRPVRVRRIGGRGFGETDLADGEAFCAMAGGRPVAIARLQGNEILPVRVLNL